MATYPGLVREGLTQLSAYQLLQPPSSEESPHSMISPYLPPVSYPTLVPNIANVHSSLSPYQISNDCIKTTNSLPYPTTRPGDLTHPLSSTKLNMLTTPHSIPDIQSLLPSPQYQLPIFYHPVSATMTHRVMTMPGMSTLSTMSTMSTLPVNYLTMPAIPPPNQTMNMLFNPSMTLKVNNNF
jgi:hypothetical protein